MEASLVAPFSVIVYQDGMDIIIKILSVHIPHTYMDKQNTI